jgi:branched-chain amino acid transport system permease protein
VTTATGSIQSITRQYPLADLLSIRLPLALLLFLPVFAPAIFPTSRLLSLAVTAAIYVIVANGLHIVFSYAGQLSLAQTALWGLGAYTSALLLNHFGLPTFVLIPAAGLMAAAGAVVIGVPAFRTAGFSFAIITFAFAEIMRLVANNWDQLTSGSIGITVLDSPDAIGSIQFDTFNHLDNFYRLTLAFAYLSLLGVFVIRQSSLGKTFIAIRENEALAKSIGINVYVYKLIAFAISGFFAGVAGVFFMYHQKHIEPGPLSPFAAFATIQFLLMILMGGRRSMLGPTIGAIVVVFGPEVVNTLLGDWLTFNRSQMIFGGVLALSVLTAPNGIAGQTRDGYNTFVMTLRSARRRGYNPLFAFFYAFSRATIPARFRPRDDAVDRGEIV